MTDTPSEGLLRLGGDEALDAGDAARYVVLPAPLEQTTSYMKGTRHGPASLLEASTQTELFDEECGDAHLAFIHSLPALRCADTASALHEIQSSTARLFRDGKVPLVLGGEHTVTAPVVAALTETQGPCGVVIFDAHADLRDTYEGTPYSHACVTRRLHELPGMTPASIVQIGIRSLSAEEYHYAQQHSLLLLPPCDPSP
jgi:agmatinase